MTQGQLTNPPNENFDVRQELLNLSRKVAGLAVSLTSVMTVLGVLTIIGGVVIAFQSNTIDLGNGYVASSHPYVQFGIIAALSGLLEILIFRLIFNYIEMQARYRTWQLRK